MQGRDGEQEPVRAERTSVWRLLFCLGVLLAPACAAGDDDSNVSSLRPSTSESKKSVSVQGTLTGQTCKKPLADVTVYLKIGATTGGKESKATDFVTTGKDGTFSFDGVQEGSYTFVAADCFGLCTDSKDPWCAIEQGGASLDPPQGKEKGVTISPATAAQPLEIALDVERKDRFSHKCGVDRDCDGVVDRAAGGTDCKDDDAAVVPKGANDQDCNGLGKKFSTKAVVATSMAWTGASFLLSDTAKSSIVTLDPTGSVQSTITAGSEGGIAQGIAWIGDALSSKQIYAAVDGKILVLSKSGSVVSSFTAPSSSVCSISLAGSTLWASDEKTVYRLSSSGAVEISFSHYAQAPPRDLPAGSSILAVPRLATSAALACPEIAWDGKQLLVLTKATISANGAYQSTISTFNTSGIKQTGDILVPARISGMAWVSDRLHVAVSNAPTPVGETTVYEVLP